MKTGDTMRDIERAKEEIQDILDTQEYQTYYDDNRNFLAVWWDRFTHWLEDILSNLLPSSASSSGLTSVVIFMVVAAVIVLIGLVVFFLVRKTRRRQSPHDSLPLEYLKEADWSYSRHLKEAQNEEMDENYTGAIRHLFLALLLYFHEKEWLRAGNWKTNGEYVAELREVNQQYATIFYHLAITFEEVVYGKRILQKAEYLRFREEAMKWLREGTDKWANDEGV